MKRVINGCEIDWSSERVFAERQNPPKYGYLFDVSANRKRNKKMRSVGSNWRRARYHR
jgi:hypothetical protein